MSTRNYVFTINSPTEADRLVLSSLEAAPAREKARVRFVIFQLERGTDGGNLHLQGYIQFCDKIRRPAACKRLGQRAWCHSRDGTHDQAVVYASKEETRVEGPWTYGEPNLDQGQRNDLKAIQKVLDDGASIKEVSDNFFSTWVRYHRAFTMYRDLHSTPRNADCRAHIFWGVTGSGKSHRARELFPDAYWMPGGDRLWFDGYDGQSAIIFEEFYGESLSYSLFLRLCDKYPLKLPVKGGFVECSAVSVVFTSNADPKTWYPQHSFDAIARRSTITHFGFAYVANLP